MQKKQNNLIPYGIVLILFFLFPFCPETGLTQDLVQIIREKRWENLPQTISNPIDGEKMILIPAGEFPMGIPEGSPLSEKLPDAVPEHTVYLDAYYMDQYEVTNEQYSKFLKAKGGKNPLFFIDGNYNSPRQPVVGVSYEDAMSYAHWAGKRLPTEAEWEKAARGADRRLYPWGSSFMESYCNSYASQGKFPVDAGKYPEGASPYGIMDMAGNVSEWVFDLYSRSYYKNSPYKNPQGPSGQISTRITRGGDYKSDPPFITCVSRFQAGAYSAFPNIGFRCVVSVSDLEPLFDPSIVRSQTPPGASGITVITEDKATANVISDKSDMSIYNPNIQASFKKVRYFKNIDFDGVKCVGASEIYKGERLGIPYWKVYFDSPGKISQAQFYDKREKLQILLEPVYDSLVREKEIKLFDQKGRLIYRSERIFQDGKPVKGILYSLSGDYLGEEKF
jgi:iron(II)-dependent oxidoreductase